MIIIISKSSMLILDSPARDNLTDPSTRVFMLFDGLHGL